MLISRNRQPRTKRCKGSRAVMKRRVCEVGTFEKSRTSGRCGPCGDGAKRSMPCRSRLVVYLASACALEERSPSFVLFCYVRGWNVCGIVMRNRQAVRMWRCHI